MVEKTLKHSIIKDLQGRNLPCELQFCNYMRGVINDMGVLVEKKFDNIGLICGYEGSGKSALGMQMCKAIDKDFSVERIAFTQEQFMDLVDELPPRSAILWDEADEMGAHHADKNLKILKSKMKRIRKNRLHIIWITPTAWDLNKYFTVARARWLIHVYTDDLERGFLRYFAGDKKRQLVIKGRRDWDWYCAKPNFYTSFADYPEGWDLDMEAYENKKDEATRALTDDNPENILSAAMLKKIRMTYLENLYKYNASHDRKMTQKDLAYVFNVENVTIHNYLKELGYLQNGVEI